jgi:ribosomal protein S18 acetylase RimI-like enzyme
LRPARLDDLEQIIEVCAHSFPGSLRWVVGTERPCRWWRTTLESDSSEEWVAQRTGAGTIVGVMILVHDERLWRALGSVRQPGKFEQLSAVLHAPGRLQVRWRNARQPVAPAVAQLRQAKRYDPADRIFLELIATLPEAQGCGIGKRMLALAFERAHALNRSAIACVVDPANSAIPFYHKLGFGITGRSQHGINLSASVFSVE